MAETKKFASSIQTDSEEIFFKDADARTSLSSLESNMPTLAAEADIRAIVTGYEPSNS